MSTTGAISPKVTQDTPATTICRTGYTKSIRPPASITEIEKRESAAAYGYTGSLKDVEYDHLVRLELGGAMDKFEHGEKVIEAQKRIAVPRRQLAS
jgi:hypothetical protein